MKVKNRHPNLHPKLRCYLEEMDLIPEPNKIPSIEELRIQIENRAVELCQEKIQIAQTQDLEINVSKTTIPIRIYHPSKEGNFPILVYIHGGGWIFGSINSHDNLCRYLCKKAHCIVVSIGYRLSPEYKYPIPLEDVYESILWIHKNAHNFSGIKTKIAIAGDSAGGNIIAVISQMIRDRKGPKITCVILAYPALDLYTFDTLSYKENDRIYGLTYAEMQFFKNQYLNPDNDPHIPEISPIYNPNLHNLPPTLINVSEFDVFRDEGIKYANLLKEAGCSVSLDVGAGLIHGGVFWAVASPIYSKQLEKTVKFIQTHLR